MNMLVNNVGSPTPAKGTTSVTVPAEQARKILDRALNTLDPADTPEWARDLSDELLPGDVVTITIRRGL